MTHAICMTAIGGPDVLTTIDHPIGVPGRGEARTNGSVLLIP